MKPRPAPSPEAMLAHLPREVRLLAEDFVGSLEMLLAALVVLSQADDGERLEAAGKARDRAAAMLKLQVASLVGVSIKRAGQSTASGIVTSL